MHRSLLVPALFALLLPACERGPESLAAEARPLPTQGQDAPWRLPLEGASNVRDLGGYRTADGLQVKRGLVFRSDELSGLTEADQQYLMRLQLKHIVDFRTPQEVEIEPSQLPPVLMSERQHMPINAGDDLVGREEITDKLLSGDTASLDLPNRLVHVNASLVRDFTPVYREWIHGLLREDGAPTMFHCSGGKDRTGLAAALLLTSLGVSRETVIQDYLASNTFLEGKYTGVIWLARIISLGKADIDGMRTLMGVEERYLLTAFQTMEAQYGSVDNYLRDGLGVDDATRAKLREKFLETPAG